MVERGVKMQRKKWKIIGCFLAMCCVLLGSTSTATAATTFETIGNVTPSKIAYDVELNDVNMATLRNVNAIDLTVGKRYFMVYTVEKVTQNKLNQNGLLISKEESSYPYEQGMMKYSTNGTLLFEEGATYFYRIEVTKDGFDYVIAKQSKDDSKWIELPIDVNSINDGCFFFGVWMTGPGPISAKLTSVLCYDEQGNNLGVKVHKMVGKSSVKKLSTMLEDYSYCEAVYWCEENQTTIILDDELHMGIKVEKEDADTAWYTYSVKGTTLSAVQNKDTVNYEYYYSFLRDSQGNKYVRLNNTKVTFVTGLKEHKGNKTVVVTAEEGYKVEKPENPKVEGYSFKSWCLSDGTVYDFDKYVVDSITLYAQYEDGDGHEYLMADAELPNNSFKNLIKPIALSVGISFLTIGIILLIWKREKRQEVKKYEE